jgi:hypothetical protein
MPTYTWPDGTRTRSRGRRSWPRAAKPQKPSGAGFSGLPSQLTPAQTAFLGQNAPAGGNTGATPGVTPQPYDPAAANAALVGNRNIALAKGEGAYQLGNLGFDYGYNPDGSVNTANPYSRAALYQLAYTNSKRGTTNSLAARGQLYSGAMVNAQNENDRSTRRTRRRTGWRSSGPFTACNPASSTRSRTRAPASATRTSTRC